MATEIWLEPGGDFVQQANGDLLLAFDTDTTSDATRQRLLRTLLTNPRIIGSNGIPISAPDDLFHPDFGAGLPALVDQPIGVVISQAQARIRRWLAIDPTIKQNPAPVINVTQVDIATVQVSVECETVGGKRVQITFPLGVPQTPPAAGVPTGS